MIFFPLRTTPFIISSLLINRNASRSPFSAMWNESTGLREHFLVLVLVSAQANGQKRFHFRNFYVSNFSPNELKLPSFKSYIIAAAL